MKKVPFYQNDKSNKGCMLAVYQSIFDGLLNKKLTWQEIDKLTGRNGGKAAWTIQILTYLSNFNIDIKMIEAFDYKSYYKLGQPYLETIFNPDELSWQLDNSNIIAMRVLIPEFLVRVSYQCRSAQIKDIEEMLNEDRIVFVTLDSKSLNNKPGYSNHAVLIFDQEEEYFIFHDPGLPPVPYRKEKKTKVFESMGGINHHNEVTGLKQKTS